MRAVVTGMIATFPVAGAAWDYGQYAVGLQRLGFDVTYLEDPGHYGWDPDTGEATEDMAGGARWLGRALDDLEPAAPIEWHVRGADGGTYGLAPEELAERVAEADVFLNVSGGCALRDEYLRARRLVMIDTDPGWNHFVTFPRQLNGAGGDTHPFTRHHAFFTYAARLGRDDCPLPSFGLDWRPTRPPVLVDRWHVAPAGDVWTTVMNWNSYTTPFEHDGARYGSKEVEFERFERLPERSPAPLEAAVRGKANTPREHWRRLGWRIADPVPLSSTVDGYREYVQRSRGEFSVAKNVYVATRCGWFSCRSVCYLAAGRPVVLQDTGFGDVMGPHDGLLPFGDMDGAVRALAEAERDYERHSTGARALAEERFRAETVLSELLEQVL